MLTILSAYLVIKNCHQEHDMQMLDICSLLQLIIYQYTVNVSTSVLHLHQLFLVQRTAILKSAPLPAL